MLLKYYIVLISALGLQACSKEAIKQNNLKKQQNSKSETSLLIENQQLRKIQSQESVQKQITDVFFTDFLNSENMYPYAIEPRGTAGSIDLTSTIWTDIWNGSDYLKMASNHQVQNGKLYAFRRGILYTMDYSGNILNSQDLSSLVNNFRVSHLSHLNINNSRFIQLERISTNSELQVPVGLYASKNEEEFQKIEGIYYHLITENRSTNQLVGISEPEGLNGQTEEVDFSARTNADNRQYRISTYNHANGALDNFNVNISIEEADPRGIALDSENNILYVLFQVYQSDNYPSVESNAFISKFDLKRKIEVARSEVFAGYYKQDSLILGKNHLVTIPQSDTRMLSVFYPQTLVKMYEINRDLYNNNSSYPYFTAEFVSDTEIVILNRALFSEEEINNISYISYDLENGRVAGRFIAPLPNEGKFLRVPEINQVFAFGQLDTITQPARWAPDASIECTIFETIYEIEDRDLRSTCYSQWLGAEYKSRTLISGINYNPVYSFPYDEGKVSVGETTANSAAIHWTAPLSSKPFGDEIKYYEVQRLGPNGTQSFKVSPNHQWFFDRVLESDQRYAYLVRAVYNEIGPQSLGQVQIQTKAQDTGVATYDTFACRQIDPSIRPSLVISCHQYLKNDAESIMDVAKHFNDGGRPECLEYACALKSAVENGDIKESKYGKLCAREIELDSINQIIPHLSHKPICEGYNFHNGRLK